MAKKKKAKKRALGRSGAASKTRRAVRKGRATKYKTRPVKGGRRP